MCIITRPSVGRGRICLLLPLHVHRLAAVSPKHPCSVPVLYPPADALSKHPSQSIAERLLITRPHLHACMQGRDVPLLTIASPALLER